MSDLRAAAQQALEALEGFVRFAAIHSDGPDASDKYHAEDYAEEAFLKTAKVLPDLRAALEQPERAQAMRDAGYTRRPTLREMAEPVQEPEQEPLSDEELDRLWREPMSADWEHREFARAVEAAHGIKENT
jgi:hypothetical protein